ncbi:GNAT family N-acetyltransferase [Agrobacterium rhizogenes]|nr:GNAT family N-acetyltransferase [Rhizobium rhizogenes]
MIGSSSQVMGLLRFRPRKMAHRATLVSVYVRTSERGTGIAADLLSVVSNVARSLGILQMELAVNAENSAALRFYQRHGFVEVGRIPGGLVEGDRELDDVRPLTVPKTSSGKIQGGLCRQMYTDGTLNPLYTAA